MFNVYLQPLVIGIIGVVIIVILFCVFLFIILRNIYKNIIRMQETLMSSLNDIYIVLQGKYDLLNEKYNTCDKMFDVKYYEDSINKAGELLKEKENVLTNRDEYISLLQDIHLLLTEFNRNISQAIENNNLTKDKKIVNIDMRIEENEEYIQSTRRLFNANSSVYNKQIVMFPNSIIAKAIKTTACPYFHIEDATQENIIVK